MSALVSLIVLTGAAVMKAMLSTKLFLVEVAHSHIRNPCANVCLHGMYICKLCYASDIGRCVDLCCVTAA